MSRRPTRAGFTLIELLVAMGIFGLVLAGVMRVFTSQHRSYVAHELVVDTQQDARVVAELMLADIRTAGFLYPRIAGISSRDGGTGAADALCISDSGVLAEARIVAATLNRLDRARLAAAVGAGASTVTLVALTMDVDNDGNDDFAVGQGIIIADGSDTHCARITQIVANQIQFTPNTPAGFAVGVSAGRVVPAIVYELFGSGLWRNGLLLSTQVEDVQVEFGVDLDDDDQIEAGEFPFDDLTGRDPSLVRSVQLSVIGRTVAENPQVEGAGRPAAANRTAGPADNFRRRRFTASVFPRNLR